MPRKDKTNSSFAKKNKKPKKPRAAIPKIRPPKLKPCLDCGYKTGSAFSIPFGYADRLGTIPGLGSRTPVAPVVNINLGDYLNALKPPVAPKKEISIQTETERLEPLASALEPLDNVKVKSDRFIPIARPFMFPSPFPDEVEGAYITEAEAAHVKPKRQYIRKTAEEREAEKNRPRRKYTKKQG